MRRTFTLCENGKTISSWTYLRRLPSSLSYYTGPEIVEIPLRRLYVSYAVLILEVLVNIGYLFGRKPEENTE